MHVVSAIIRGLVAALGLFGVAFPEDVIVVLETSVVSIASAVLAIWAAWPAIRAGFNKARGVS